MPAEDMSEPLETIAMLEAMYPLPEEFELSPGTAEYLSNPAGRSLSQLEVTLRIELDTEPDKRLELYIAMPAVSGSHVKIVPRQPDWLSRSTHEELLDSIVPHNDETSSEYILAVIEIVREKASELAAQEVPIEREVVKQAVEERLERVWFWFPSLSTKEKRRDLVEYAPRFGLTGFVLAGKPGLLCLEGDGRQVDRYMSAIKSESWSDIPPFQKKVTERLRKPLASSGDRKFSSMSEITHLIPQYGQYNHRGEMSEVKRLMETWGVGEDFSIAVMNMSST